MASGYSPFEIEVTITSAKDLKNVNWRHGDLRPYAVVWVDRSAKCSTRVDEEGDTSPVWNEKLTIPLKDRPEEATLYIDIVHAGAEQDTKPLIGSARIPLSEIVDEAGLGQPCVRKPKLKRPSGRPQGKLEIKIAVHQCRYQPPQPYAPPYGQQSREIPGYGYGGYGAAPPPPYAAAPPSGYPYAAPPIYGAPPAYGGQPAYGGPPAYGAPPAAYASAPPYGSDPYYAGGGTAATPEKAKSKYGMGTGLAVGAVAGVLGGLALAEGVDYVEDRIADDAAEKVEDDLGYDDDF